MANDYTGALRSRPRSAGPVDPRAAGFTKDTVSGMVSWWAGSHLQGYTAGQQITALPDKSGTLDWTIGGVDARPAWYPASSGYGCNGWPILWFDQTDYAYQNNNIGTPASVWVVSRAYTAAYNLRVLTAYGNNWILGHWGGYEDQAYFAGWVYNPSTSQTNTWYIYGCDITGSGTNSNFYKNSTTATASNQGGVVGPNQLGINVYSGLPSPTEASQCFVAEVMAWGKVLSSAERSTVFDYLNTKYAIA